MIKPFKLLNGYTYSNELHEPYIPLQITHAPPFDISHRHWNMLPQDLRGGTLIHMEIYIEGWEAFRNNITVNPYEGIINDPMVIEWGELWNRGRIGCLNRRTRIYRETEPEYYNTDEYIFFDVTEVMPDFDDHRPYKFMLFRHIEEGNTVQGQRIYSDHPMYNFPDVI
jgi:hypothetical protein